MVAEEMNLLPDLSGVESQQQDFLGLAQDGNIDGLVSAVATLGYKC